MKKIENSFFIDVKKFYEGKTLKKINSTIKNNVWLIPLIYIIGILVILFRNYKYGLQFQPISLIQFSLMTFYLAISLATYSIIKYYYIFLFQLLLSFVINDKIIILRDIIVYFIFMPFIASIFVQKISILSDFFIVLVFISIILDIPMSLGGLGGQKVIYHDYRTNTENTYMYYGNYEDVYQFINDGNTVLLIPKDNGYISYKNGSN